MAGYSFENLKENMAKASFRNVNISPKQGIEICNYVRGRQLGQAKMLLQQSIDMIRPVPLKRFTNGPGHKSGMASGRYYPKACSEILKALESAEANAKNKGLNVSELMVAHIATQRAAKQSHYGRKKRSIFKTSHIEVVLAEVKNSGKSKKEKPVAKDAPVKDKKDRIVVKKEVHKDVREAKSDNVDADKDSIKDIQK
jgi:large subunit ribosomal protein L22